MAQQLTLTSGSFVYIATAVSGTSAINTLYDLTDTQSYDRRIYGISCTSTDNGAQTLTIFLSSSTAYQLYQVNVPLNSGNGSAIAMTDVFGSSNAAAIFQKQKDQNGVPYFNLPANTKLQYQYNTAFNVSTERLNLVTFGETYQ